MFMELALAAAINSSCPKVQQGALYDTVTVRSGDTLSEVGTCTGHAWYAIYDVNRDKVDNPHDIDPGIVLRLPGIYERSIGVSPSLSTVVVSNDPAFDTLSELAAWAGTTWQVLYDLNRDQISNPDVIYAGQILKLPHSM